MANTLKPYLDSVRLGIEEAFALQRPPSKNSEAREKPQVEMRTNADALFESITIKRTKFERTLIERSNNSTRISVLIKQVDGMEEVMCHKFMRFLMQRAEDFQIMRRVPIEGYSISFLVTNKHLKNLKKNRVTDFIIHFMTEVDKEISEMKLEVNARSRFVASEFMKEFLV